MPQAVHFFVIAVPDDIALPDGKGRLVADGGGNVAADIVQGVQFCRQLRQAAVGKAGELLFQVGQLFNGGAEGGQVPAAGGAVDDAADEPLHIPQAGHPGNQLLPADGVVHQRGHGAAAAVDVRHGQQGPLQPAAEHPAPHGGLGLVQHPEKAALFLLAAKGLRQFQVPAGGQVQFHKAALTVVIQFPDVGEVGFLGLVKVAQQSAQGHGGGRLPGRQPGKGLVAELGADVFLRLCQPEPALPAVFAAAVELVGKNLRQRLFAVGPVAQNGLGGIEPTQFVDDVGQCILAGEGG